MATMNEFLAKALNEKTYPDEGINQALVEDAFEEINDITQDILASTARAFKYLNSMDKKVIRSEPWNSDFKNIISSMVKVDKEIQNLYKKVDLE